MNKIVPILILAAILAVTLFFTFIDAFKNGQFTCNKYILNTYLYVLLSFLFLSMTILLLNYFKVKFVNHPMLFMIGSFLITLLCIIGIGFISPKKVILKHIVWLVCLASIGFGAYPLFEIIKTQDILAALITMVFMVAGLSAYTFMYPDTISLKWGPALFYALIGLILFEIISLLVVKDKNRPLLFRILSGIFVVLFSIYLLYDTKKMKVAARKCNESTNPPDYIRQSFNIFYDMYVILINLLSVFRK